MNPFPATVLLVDDDEPARYVLRRWLAHLDVRCEVLEAASGAQALAAVRDYCQNAPAPDSLLVLLDLNMPEMDGLEFLEHQAQLPTKCRAAMAVVVLCAAASPEDLARARAMAAGVQFKPLDVNQLAALVYEYLPAARPIPL